MTKPRVSADLRKWITENKQEIADALNAINHGCYICRPDDPNAAEEGCSDCERDFAENVEGMPHPEGETP